MCTAALLVAIVSPVAAEPLLPDLIAWARETPSQFTCHMYCGFLDSQFVPGKVVYRFVGALPNIGAGPLIVREVTDGNSTQTVYQRFLDSATPGDNNIFTEQVIGVFPDADPTPPRHLWLPGIAQYKLREVTAEGGVGSILSMNDKTSMAVVDSAAYNKNLPGAPASAFYTSVSAPILGISIGYADVYGLGFQGQWADATGLPSGTYWLEVTVNPYGGTPEGRVVESDYSNNSTRILVDILPGDYNDDGEVDAADYTVWRNSLGQSVAVQTTGADGDGDGAVDSGDYQVWKAHFGEAIPMAAAGSVTLVPEPTALVPLAIALAALLPPHVGRVTRRPCRHGAGGPRTERSYCVPGRTTIGSTMPPRRVSDAVVSSPG